VLHLLIQVQHKLQPKCNRCRRIKPTPTADYANNTMQEQPRLLILCRMITIQVLTTGDFSIGKASSTTVVTVTGAPFIIPVQHKPSYRKCNRCRRIKPTPTADYANNTNAGTATAYTLQEMITIQVLTTART
jgi:hypothetical protein